MQDLLHRPMSRKTFLVTVGMLVLAATGINETLKRLTHPQLLSNPPTPQYGSGVYGGLKT